LPILSTGGGDVVELLTNSAPGLSRLPSAKPSGHQPSVALTLLSYFALILLKILQWPRDKTACLNLSIRLLAFHVRRYILVERITVTMKTMKIRFKQNILDTYLEQLCV